MNFTERLKLLVAEDGREYNAIAKEMGISAPALTNYLRGRMPKIEEIKKIARFFGKSLDDIFEWEPAAELKKRYEGVAAIASSLPLAHDEQQRFFTSVLLVIAQSRGSLKEARDNIDDSVKAIDILDQEVKKLRTRTKVNSLAVAGGERMAKTVRERNRRTKTRNEAIITKTGASARGTDPESPQSTYPAPGSSNPPVK